MDRNNRVKLLLPVIGCCALLMLSQIAADMIFTIFIVAGMNIDGMTSAEADALLYEKLTACSSEIMILAYVFTLIGLAVWAKLSKKKFVQHTSLNLKTTKPVGILAFLAGVAANIWFGLMVGMIPWPDSWVEEYMDAASELVGSSLPLEIIAIVIFAPLVEEILFRGMVFRYLSMALPAGAALVFQGLLFGGMHGTMIWIVYASVLGCVFGYVRARTGSLHATILMHMGFNAGSYLFSYLAAQWGDSGQALLIGLVGSAALFLLMLYGIEYRLDDEKKVI